MREVTEKFNVYKYSEASEELKEKIIDEITSCPSYGDWLLEERIETLKAFAKHFDLKLDYCLGVVPDRGEFIKFDGEAPTKKELEELNKKDCPLTGCYYDHDLIEAAIKHDLTQFISSIHREYEYLCSDEAIAEHCEANDYEFTENGKLY